jgi:enamine deaminase RidA (YjgF/YER057c/UK114 family)
MTTPFTRFSVAKATNDLVYVSGVTSRDKHGAVVGDDIVTQTHQVLKCLAAVVADASGSMAEVVKITTFVRDADDIATVSAIRREYFADPLPAATSVEVSRLFDPRHLVEIDAVVAISPPVEGHDT